MRIFISLGACLFMFCSGVQAQGKFGNFLKKVNKTLEETNQTLEDVNNVLDGKDVSTDENGETKIVSPTRDLQLKFEKCYDEGHDVVVALKITNTTDKEIGLNWGSGRAWDDDGNMYEFGSSEFTVSGKEVSPTGVGIPAGIPVNACIILRGVNKKATVIKLVKFDTYQYKGFERFGVMAFSVDPELVISIEPQMVFSAER